MGNDDEFSQLQARRDHGLAESSEVVLIGVTDLLDEAVNTEALEQPGHLAATSVGQESAQDFVLHAADVELASRDGAEQGFLIGVEEIESGVGAALVLHRLRELVEFIATIAGADRNSR